MAVLSSPNQCGHTGLPQARPYSSRVAGSRSSGLACDLELAGNLPSSLRGTGRRHPLRLAAAWLMPLLGAGQVSATG